MSAVIDKRIIIPGLVLDVNDPLMLGRIRVLPKIENQQQGQPEKKEEWTKLDPFVCLPLLPYYISQIPKVGEYVGIIYSTRDETKDWNKFYVQGPITRPWNNYYESFNSSQAMLANGDFIKQADTIRDTDTGEIQKEVTGIYPLPGDNAILGRGSSDVLIKTQDVILRSGKYVPSPNNDRPDSPQIKLNDSRSFVQLSFYDLEKVQTGTETVSYEEYKDLQLQNYIEWSIDGVDINTQTVSGYVQTNSVVPILNGNGTTVSTFEISFASIAQCFAVPNSKMEFSGLTISQASLFINQYIKGFNKGKISMNGYNDYPNNGFLNGQFPFVFGPNLITYNKMLGNDPIVSNFISAIYNNIKLFDASNDVGFAVIWSKNTVGPQTTTKEQEIEKSEYKESPVTYASVGGDFLYLLSHRSVIPGTTPINLSNTLYGIPQEKFTDEILPSTNSMVRGEELLKLLRLIVSFLTSHTHNINEPPIQEPLNSVTVSQIETAFNNAYTTVLNQNIRIN